ncbi:hypothetical protein K466DRAFT_592367 [Polyporus arcularius HHB13444]|uniref:Uncharacterized protein n=1 Tax=Polyporus arcularius HHB13444 TaxID=1314778 RepID=A0A5C3NPP3_9APHY|nr:hypothetical protein K466DRAFT_592367 [Polyporus arcularius HHB13444]
MLAGAKARNSVRPTPAREIESHPLLQISWAGMKRLVQAWVAAARRAVHARFDVFEIQGGSFENRILFPLEVVDAVRAMIPPDMPL